MPLATAAMVLPGAITLPASSLLTPRATPIRVPSTSRPRMVPAQCVPCPFVSSAPVSVKSMLRTFTPVNAGCVSSTPVSSTATVTPAPVSVVDVAPIASRPHPPAPALPPASGATRATGMGSTTIVSGTRRSSPASASVSISCSNGRRSRLITLP